MRQKKHIRFDWAIKRLLKQRANFGILEGFLSELIKEDIKIVEILDGESMKETEEDKHNRVDVLVRDKQGDLIIIEVQNTYAIDYFLRILYGISKAITEHIKEGAAYSKIKKIISVNIIYFELGHGSDYVYKGTTSYRGIHDHQLLNLTAAQKKYFSKEKVEEIYPEIYLIKVNTFDDNAKDTLDEWIYFLKNSEIKQNFTAKGIKEADKVLKVANMSDAERREYKRYVEVLSDRASIAETIEFESELKAQQKVKQRVKEAVKEAKAETAEAKAETAEAKAAAERKIERAMMAMLKNTNLTDKEVSDALGVEIERVRASREK